MQARKLDGSFRDWLLIAFFAVGSIVGLAVVEISPRETHDGLAVVFPPWIGGAEAINRAVSAGASVLRVGRYPFIVVVEAETPNYSSRVRGDGAWAVLDIGTFGGCLSRGMRPS